MEWCPANGNIGFPVNITGSVSENDNVFQVMQGQKEAYLAFAPYSQPRIMVNRSGLPTNIGRCFMTDSKDNTLTYKGLLYRLADIQFCQSTHSGSNWPKKPAPQNAVDMVFTYHRSSSSSKNYPNVFLVIVPIYLSGTITNSKPNSSVAEEFFTEVVNNTNMTLSEIPQPAFKTKFMTLDPLFKNLSDKACVTYITCVQLRAPPINDQWTLKSTNIGVVYFPGGWIISSQNEKLLWTLGGKGKLEFSPYILPSSTRNSWLTPIRAPPLEGSDTKTVVEFLREGSNWSNGQINGTTISVADTNFPKRFQWIQDGVAIGTTEGRLKTTSDYTCLPLNKIKDVQGKYVLLDPATGRRTLKDELELSPDEKAALEATQKSGSAATTFAIVIGSIMAGIVLLVGASFLVRFLLKRVNTQAGVEAIQEAAKHLTPDASTSS